MKPGDLVKGIRYHDKMGHGIVLHVRGVFASILWADRISVVFEEDLEVVNESR